MSLKDKIIDVIGVRTYEFGRGIFQGVFLGSTYIKNTEAKNYTNSIYWCGFPITCVSGVFSVGGSLWAGMNYLSPESIKCPEYSGIISFTLLTTNILNAIFEMNRNTTQQPTNWTNNLPAPATAPKKSTDIDPWCDLEEPEQKTTDPWVNLENKIQ